jgi:acetylornithine deacetylase/succinyl-diaminopimelate desuccinylase-like protein
MTTGTRDDWIAAATARIDAERLRELVCGLVDIPSPTGQERRLARHLSETMTTAGLHAELQPLDESQANAWGRVVGDGSGPSIMLYAPIDTFSTGDPDLDLPAIGAEWRADMAPVASVVDDLVVGLGASNPKGHAACVLAAAEAIAAAQLPLRGDVIAAFGAGGMPTNALPDSSRRNVGQGVGCSFLLEQGVWPDFAVIAKPGWSISWEEVGLTWFEVTVRGTHTYVGSRHRLPYRNAIADAGAVIARLEEWFVEYARRHTDGLVEPQGIVASVEGGWWRMAAAAPASCRFLVDLRLSPRTTPAQARREFGAALTAIAADLAGLQVEWRQVLAIPGATTDVDSWICRSGIAAFEAVSGQPPEPALGNSGATDANILRSRGVATIRVGMPKVKEAPFEIDFTAGMNTVDVADMARLTRLLVHVAVDTATRTLEEVGVQA